MITRTDEGGLCAPLSNICEMVETIPKETNARILQTCSFEHNSTRITEETLTMLQGYMEILVREAVLRSLANKEQAKQQDEGLFRSSNIKNENSEVELTHEDLENIAGLLLLDM